MAGLLLSVLLQVRRSPVGRHEGSERDGGLKSNFKSDHLLTSCLVSHSGKTHLSVKSWWKKLVIKYFMSFIIAYLWRVCHSVDLSAP